MRLPEFLLNVPRIAYIIAVPVVVFAATVAISLATSGGGDDGDKLAVNPTVRPSLDNIDAPATTAPQPTTAPAPTTEPTPEPAPNREDCDEIRGTDYLSGEEREWFLANCIGGTQNANAGAGSGAPSGNTPPSSGAPPSSGGATATGGAPYAGEFALGDRLIIPSIGIDAVVTGAVVPPSGSMPDPVGYFNAVWYDFKNFPGLGGYVEGNLNLAAHVDCAHCHNGGSGTALFWSVRNLGIGATAQYITGSGQVYNYVVSASYPVSPNVDWSGIVATGAARMTLITCTGTFSGGDYDTRHVVQFSLVGGG